MMNGAVMCGIPMMAGMALIATLLVTALALWTVAAVKYLRSGIASEGHDAPFDRRAGER